MSADKQALDILTEKKDVLNNLAEILLDMEKITGEQFDEIFNGKTLADFKASEEVPSKQNEETVSTDENNLEG